ncbi:MAG: hypothetical protein NRZ50_00495 [Bacillus paranthracis]|nr:MAG: hypothetical protein NRZ50_00495 [Bacillus paranthracis]
MSIFRTFNDFLPFFLIIRLIDKIEGFMPKGTKNKTSKIDEYYEVIAALLSRLSDRVPAVDRKVTLKKK